MNTNYRILHVDDEPDFLALTAEYLEGEHDRFRIETATSATDGLDILDQSEIDCIVSDYEMPGANGIEFLESVRARHPDLPFILFTGKGSEEIASRAISAGVTDYFHKGGAANQFAILANRLENAADKYRTEQQLDATRRQYQAVSEQNLAGIYLIQDGEFVYVNPKLADIHGYERETIIGMSPLALVAPEERDRVQQQLRRRLDGEVEDVQYETVGLTKDGDRIDIELHGSHITYEGSPAVIGTELDITERKERQRELQDSHERYRSLFENNPLIIWEQDFSAGKQYLDDLAERTDDLEAYLEANIEHVYQLLERIEITDINENALAYYEAPSKEVLLENFEQVFTEDALESFISACVALAEGQQTYRTETVARTLNGKRKHELLELYVPDAYTDDLSRVYVTGTDITERKEQEKELERQNERFAEFGSVVSHDLRNPLNVASGRLELAQRECDSDYLDETAQAHDRMESLIDDLLALAREGKRINETDAVDLASTIDRCWATTETGDATLITDTEQTIRADPSRLQALLENLFRNAVEHVGDNVTVTVGDLTDGSGFYVADDGIGIPTDKSEQLFDTGYSTKEGGTGFGLNIVQKIAKAHGWNITVTDSEDRGTRFEITDVEVTDG